MMEDGQVWEHDMLCGGNDESEFCYLFISLCFSLPLAQRMVYVCGMSFLGALIVKAVL